MYNVQNCDITNKLISTASAFDIPTVIRLVLNDTKKLEPLSSSQTIDDKTAKAQLRELNNSFYREVSRRALRSLKFDDKLMFIVRLAQIATNGNNDKMLTTQEADLLFRGAANLETSNATLSKYKESMKGTIIYQYHISHYYYNYY